MRIFLLLAGFATGSTLLLAASLRFPEVLLDVPPVGAALVRQHPVLGMAGLLGLAVCGLLVPAASRAHRALGWVGGGLLTASALLALVPLWGNGFTVVARVAFWCAAVAPLVLAAWTVVVARERGRAAAVPARSGSCSSPRVR